MANENQTAMCLDYNKIWEEQDEEKDEILYQENSHKFEREGEW